MFLRTTTVGDLNTNLFKLPQPDKNEFTSIKDKPVGNSAYTNFLLSLNGLQLLTRFKELLYTNNESVAVFLMASRPNSINDSGNLKLRLTQPSNAPSLITSNLLGK